jgi:hypothetical protein
MNSQNSKVRKNLIPGELHGTNGKKKSARNGGRKSLLQMEKFNSMVLQPKR